jgi:hypothetical protein
VAVAAKAVMVALHNLGQFHQWVVELVMLPQAEVAVVTFLQAQDRADLELQVKATTAAEAILHTQVAAAAVQAETAHLITVHILAVLAVLA